MTDEAQVITKLSKVDDEQRVVYGWASVIKNEDGSIFLDKQDDFMDDISELEDMAHSFVIESRDGGEQHMTFGVSDLVESFVSTPEKLAKMGLPENALPTGWWVGFKVKDDRVWKGVKEGRYGGFSVGGSGVRTPVDDIAKHGDPDTDGSAYPHERKAPGANAAGLKRAATAFKRIKLTGDPKGSGTEEDPIAVGDDLDLAVKLLSEGKHVRLDQADEVATLLDKLAQAVADAEEKGDAAPNIDLCMVSVPGTNLFCHDNKGIPRASMPQFKGQVDPGTLADAKRKTDDTEEEVSVEDEFRDSLKSMGIPTKVTTMKASHLRATQSELVGTKVAGMVKARKAGEFPDKKWNAPIFVTRDGYVIDGHHRWAAVIGIDAQDGELGDEEMSVEIVDMEIGAAIDFATTFTHGMGIRQKGTGADAEGVKKEEDLPCFGCLDPKPIKKEIRVSKPAKKVDPLLVALAKSLVTKHGNHDQKDHGNWSKSPQARNEADYDKHIRAMADAEEKRKKKYLGEVGREAEQKARAARKKNKD